MFPPSRSSSNVFPTSLLTHSTLYFLFHSKTKQNKNKTTKTQPPPIKVKTNKQKTDKKNQTNKCSNRENETKCPQKCCWEGFGLASAPRHGFSLRPSARGSHWGLCSYYAVRLHWRTLLLPLAAGVYGARFLVRRGSLCPPLPLSAGSLSAGPVHAATASVSVSMPQSCRV